MRQGAGARLRRDSIALGVVTIGYLAIDRITSDEFGTEEVEIVNTFAGQAAVAIANAQLYMAQREQAPEDSRARHG